MIDIQGLFTTANIMQAIGTGIIVWFIRLWCETEWVTLATNKKWTGLYLPTLALAISLLISFLLPIGASVPLGQKLSQGMLCGFASGYLFSALKGVLSKEAER